MCPMLWHSTKKASSNTNVQGSIAHGRHFVSRHFSTEDKSGVDVLKEYTFGSRQFGSTHFGSRYFGTRHFSTTPLRVIMVYCKYQVKLHKSTISLKGDTVHQTSLKQYMEF